jgi:required for meiotic nuclear division protein 1
MKLLKIQAFQAAESINIKKLKADFRAALHTGTVSDLFYFFEESNRYLFVFNYGVVVFCNYDEIGKSEFMRFVKPYSENWLELDIFEDYDVELNERTQRGKIKSDVVQLPIDVSPDAIQIVMLNVGQSCALEYYEILTEGMLESTKKHILELEKHGKFSISKKNLLKFIGKVLNVKNSIVDNLYILDDPASVWDDEELAFLNRNLKSNFDINQRFKDLDYRLQIVEDNLKLFTDILQHRESAMMEYIIIILILIEVANIFREAWMGH